MNKKRTTFIAAAVVLFFGYNAAYAEETSTDKALSVDQIVNKANQTAYYQGADGKAKVNMTITDSQGRERNRELIILRWDQPNPNLSYILPKLSD